MNIYYIDYENVNSFGLKGVQLLGSDSQVNILYSKRADNIKIDILTELMKSEADVHFIPVHVGTPNALDFQLVTLLFLGYNRENRYYIISKDSGYDCCIKTALEHNAPNIRRFRDIETAVHWTFGGANGRTPGESGADSVNVRGSEDSLAEMSGRDEDMAETDLTDVGFDRIETAETGTTEADFYEAIAAEADTTEADLDEAIAGEAGMTEAGIDEAIAAEAGTTEADFDEAIAAEAGTTEAGIDEGISAEAGTTEAGTTEAGFGETGENEADMTKSDAAEAPFADTAADETGTAKPVMTDSGDKVPEQPENPNADSPHAENNQPSSHRSRRRRRPQKSADQAKSADRRKESSENPVRMTETQPQGQASDPARFPLGKVTDVISRKCSAPLDQKQLSIIRDALLKAKNKQQFYSYIVRRCGQKDGLALYHVIRCAYNDLIAIEARQTA